MSEETLSNLTCLRYNQALTSIYRLYEDKTTKKFINPETFISDSDVIIEYLYNTYQKSTIVNFISAIIWHANQMESKHDITIVNRIREIYREHGKKLKEDIERSKIGKEFQLTEKEQKSFMIWEDILETYAKIKTTFNRNHYNEFMDFVILSLYVLHPPVRADYANMAIYIDDSFVPADATHNYCVLQTNPRFVFNQYKSSKHYGATIVAMDSELHDILLDWTEINTSEYLLATYTKSTSTFTPMNENKLCKYTRHHQHSSSLLHILHVQK
jgi:hypothetical protein